MVKVLCSTFRSIDTDVLFCRSVTCCPCIQKLNHVVGREPLKDFRPAFAPAVTNYAAEGSVECPVLDTIGRNEEYKGKRTGLVS